jgi:hypothetical protein
MHRNMNHVRVWETPYVVCTIANSPAVCADAMLTNFYFIPYLRAVKISCLAPTYLRLSMYYFS